ncbi:MAG TPA: carboxypeptidase-like regulatory domain-containing protein, partial [Vicinamibacteria bacterium]|nr:carboxypeptidase-like regulatory domain-containing protein [Vicinamibacteria bacterium]
MAPATKLDLFLAPGGSLRGTVRGPDGKPLSAAAVSVASELGVFGGTATVRRTSEAGTFEAWGLPAGAYVVLVHQPGSGTAVRRVVLARNAEERVDVTLEPASRLRGRLVDEEQRPVRAAVALQEIEGQNVVATLGQVVTTEADAEGRFLLAEVPRAAVSLAVTSQGYAPKRVEATVARPDMDLGDVVVERGLAIRGGVRDAQGRPVPHADLRAHGEGPGTARGALEGHAGEDGTFLLPGAQPGLYRVRATADGYTVATERASAGGDPVVLVLERGGSLTGTVVDEKGVPVPVFRVAAEPAAEPESGRGVYAEGGDGRLELADLAAGEWLLVVTARDKEAARL